MATSKRDRQRANRDAKRLAADKVQRRRSVFTRARRIAVWAIAIIVVLILANLVFGGGGDEALATAVAG